MDIRGPHQGSRLPLTSVDIKDTPVAFTASINMLVTSTQECPATHTHSSSCTPTDTTLPRDDKTMLNTDKLNAPSPLMEDCKDTL